MSTHPVHAHPKGDPCVPYCPLNFPNVYGAPDENGRAPEVAIFHASRHAAAGDETSTAYCGAWRTGEAESCRGLNFRRLPIGANGIPHGTCSVCGSGRTVPHVDLDGFAAPVRVAVDALAVCFQADVAAWKANDEPTDGTMSPLQKVTRQAVEIAAKDCTRELLTASFTVEAIAGILASVRAKYGARS